MLTGSVQDSALQSMIFLAMDKPKNLGGYPEFISTAQMPTVCKNGLESVQGRWVLHYFQYCLFLLRSGILGKKSSFFILTCCTSFSSHSWKVQSLANKLGKADEEKKNLGVKMMVRVWVVVQLCSYGGIQPAATKRRTLLCWSQQKICFMPSYSYMPKLPLITEAVPF